MARMTIDFPLKSFIEVNKILKLYFTEYLIDKRMVFGDSLIPEVRRMAVITDPTMTLDNVVIQPNATQRELTAYRITKDKYNETDEGYEFRHLIEPEKGTDEKFDPYYPEEANLTIHKWNNPTPISEVYDITNGVDIAWQKAPVLNYIMAEDENVYDPFSNDSIGTMTLNDDRKESYNIIFTRQLFPLYEKATISAANVSLNLFNEAFGIHHTILKAEFERVTIYTLVASM